MSSPRLPFINLVHCCRAPSGEAIEASNNPGYAEAKKLAYMTEDARRYRAGVKAADDKIFEEFAFAKSEEFSKLSLDMKKVKQDAYAQELVDMVRSLKNTYTTPPHVNGQSGRVHRVGRQTTTAVRL